jgi:hypothetical protein
MQWSYRPAGSVCRPTRRTAPESIPWGSPHVVSLAASSNVEPLVCQAHPALGGPSVETDCGWNSSMRVRPRFLSRATAIGCPAFFVRFHVCVGVSWQSVDASEKLRARPLTAMQSNYRKCSISLWRLQPRAATRRRHAPWPVPTSNVNKSPHSPPGNSPGGTPYQLAIIV